MSVCLPDLDTKPFQRFTFPIEHTSHQMDDLACRPMFVASKGRQIRVCFHGLYNRIKRAENIRVGGRSIRIGCEK